jgi:hypothetical protein
MAAPSSTMVAESGSRGKPLGVLVPRAVSVRAGAAAHALAFAIEALSEDVRAGAASAEQVRVSDQVVGEHRRVLEDEGYRLAGPVRDRGELVWKVELSGRSPAATRRRNVAKEIVRLARERDWDRVVLPRTVFGLRVYDVALKDTNRVRSYVLLDEALREARGMR